MTLAFLRDLRAMLTPSTAWHPLACANADGRVLGEFEQGVPGNGRMWGTHGPRTWVPTDSIAVAWNLPCAITCLLTRWELAGRFADVPTEKTRLRLDVVAMLEAQAGCDLWQVTEHGTALKAIDGLLRSLADRSAA